MGGLHGLYFNGTNFNNLVQARTDTQIQFDWGTSIPISGVGVDNFSVSWAGDIRVPTSSTYTFYTVSDDGVRLWVNNQQIINNWTNHAPTTNSGSINLNAGQSYKIKLEYYENTGGATIRLDWSGPGLSRQALTLTNLSFCPFDGEYFNGEGFRDLALTRIDNSIWFNWGTGSPAPGVNADGFSIRWTGVVKPPMDGDYTFTTVSDDGVRLYIDDQLLIDNWTLHGETTNTGTIHLNANQNYYLRLEYFDRTGNATIRLSWSGPGISSVHGGEFLSCGNSQ